MNFLQGKKTLIATSVLILHQILKVFGYDLPQEELSTAIDTIAGVLVFFFRIIAKPKVEEVK